MAAAAAVASCFANKEESARRPSANWRMPKFKPAERPLAKKWWRKPERRIFKEMFDVEDDVYLSS